MFTILTKPAFQLALQVGHGQIKEYFSKKIDEVVIANAQDKVSKEIEKFIEGVSRRTNLYFIWSFANVLILALVVYFKNKWLSGVAVLFSLSILGFYIRMTIDSFLQIINFFENFESTLNQYIEKGFAEAKENGWQNKMALFFDSRDGKHYYRLVLDQVIQGISKWISENKNILYIRMSFYAAATACFSISLRELFIT